MARLTAKGTPTDPPIVYATFLGMHSGTGADSIWVTGSGGEVWGNLHNAELPAPPSGLATSLNGLSIDPMNEDVLYAAYGSIPFRSEDAGVTWQELP